MQHKLPRAGGRSNTANRYDHAPAQPPSPWLRKHAGLLPDNGQILDLACGSGRHCRLLAGLGHDVVGVDRDITAARALPANPRITLQQTDLETGQWPFAANRFAGIVVCNYLHRPLFPCIADSLRAGGVLLYETFARGNERFGRPRNPAFLLRPGELLAVFGMLEVLRFEEVIEGGARPAVRQRLAARKKPA